MTVFNFPTYQIRESRNYNFKCGEPTSNKTNRKYTQTLTLATASGAM